ncbi:hypothetical protein, partial [Pseudomonas aeruginosa]|uniref:hypothetical protein n=1 Tax=Pseudomonas aeruginosa TaxID=287 RepID=UPI002E811ECA
LDSDHCPLCSRQMSPNQVDGQDIGQRICISKRARRWFNFELEARSVPVSAVQYQSVEQNDFLLLTIPTDIAF